MWERAEAGHRREGMWQPQVDINVFTLTTSLIRLPRQRKTGISDAIGHKARLVKLYLALDLAFGFT